MVRSHVEMQLCTGDWFCSECRPAHGKASKRKAPNSEEDAPAATVKEAPAPEAVAVAAIVAAVQREDACRSGRGGRRASVAAAPADASARPMRSRRASAAMLSAPSDAEVRHLQHACHCCLYLFCCKQMQRTKGFTRNHECNIS